MIYDSKWEEEEEKKKGILCYQNTYSDDDHDNPALVIRYSCWW